MRIVRYDEHRPSKEQRRAFDSGVPSLDRWLATQARQSLASRDAVTHLLVDDRNRSIGGYYSLAAGQVARASAVASMARSAPEPIPAVRIGRFAIDHRLQGQGWGAELLRDAILRSISAGRVIGARVLLVDAISPTALAFSERFGFEPSPIHPLQAMLDLRIAAASAGLDPEHGAAG